MHEDKPQDIRRTSMMPLPPKHQAQPMNVDGIRGRLLTARNALREAVDVQDATISAIESEEKNNAYGEAKCGPPEAVPCALNLTLDVIELANNVLKQATEIRSRIG